MFIPDYAPNRSSGFRLRQRVKEPYIERVRYRRSSEYELSRTALLFRTHQRAALFIGDGFNDCKGPYVSVQGPTRGDVLTGWKEKNVLLNKI